MTITKDEAQKAYDDLITYRQQNVLIKSKENPGKIEIHHIVPTSLGGLDEKSNRIALLAKEHFMAHVYLWIIHHDDKFHDQMTNALINMHNGTKNGNRKELRDFILMSEDYQQAREEFGKIASKIFSEANKGEKNPMHRKIWICNFELEESKIWDKDKPIPNGWIKGRYFKKQFKKQFKKIKNKISNLEHLEQEKIIKQQFKKQKKQEYRQKKKQLLYIMFEEFKKNEFEGVVKKFGYTHTRNNLIIAFKEYIPEYIPKQCNRWKNKNKNK